MEYFIALASLVVLGVGWFLIQGWLVKRDMDTLDNWNYDDDHDS